AQTPNTPPWVALAQAEFGADGACEDLPGKCLMVPYRPKSNCPEGKTGHHLVEAHGFIKEGNIPGTKTRWRALNEKVSASAAEKRSSCITGAKNYRSGDAPTVCVTGDDHNPEENGRLLQHARIGRRQAVAEAVAAKTKGSWTYAESRDAGCAAAEEVLKPC